MAFVAIAAAGCLVDLITKRLAFAWLSVGEVAWLIPGFAGFELGLNEGAVFGMGQGAQAFFASVSAVVGVGIVVWFLRFDGASDWPTTVLLGAILGGVLGNLYDRLGLPGLAWGVDYPLRGVHQAGDPVYAVRDWILWQASDEMRWPNFNIADSLLVVSVGYLFLRSFFPPAASAGESQANTDPGSNAAE